MPITSVPADQAAFTRLMLVSIEPRTDRETNIQMTNKDGTERRWTVQVVASLPSRWDPGRVESEVLAVTLTSADDPTDKVVEGDQVWFTGLTVGVVPPEQTESGRIRGGRFFWSATGVQTRTAHGSKS